ncbi:thioredoxin family protein [Streptococcus agalactiae]|nr:thioredoxin family protein [Streptococcus agalactiae]
MNKKMIILTFAFVMDLLFLGAGFYILTNLDNLVVTYNDELTADVYVDTAIDQNVNLVFYKTGCPYCQSGKKAVVTAAKESAYPTFYIDVESDKGQQLVKQYQVEKAATIITLRDGESRLYLYAKKTQAGKITADEKTIEEALDDPKNEAQ